MRQRPENQTRERISVLFEPGIPEGPVLSQTFKVYSRPAQFSASRKTLLTQSTGLCDAGTIVLSRDQKSLPDF